MAFYGKQELCDLIACCDLYVHAADAEIEAISCIEAFSTGLVPVISDSPKSATHQFALDERSRFAPPGTATIWRVRSITGSSMTKSGKRWAGGMANTDGNSKSTPCVSQIEDMFRQAVRNRGAVGHTAEADAAESDAGVSA